MKKLSIAVVIVLAFVAGYLLPRQSTLTKGEACTSRGDLPKRCYHRIK